MGGNFKRRLAQLAQMSREGVFGAEAKQAYSDWNTEEPEGLEVFHKTINDFYSKLRNDDDRLIHKPANLFCQLLIVAYRDAKKRDAHVADGLLHSFVRDFEGVEGSCLYPQWESLALAALAFRQSVGNPLLVERQSLEMFRAYNEFLNALLPYLLITWRTALGKPYSNAVFGQSYAVRLNEFQKLTGGEDGAFYLLFRLANPKLRNAIAHSDVWIDKTTNKVKYTDGRKQKTPYEIDLVELIGYSAVGSHLAQSYLAAIASIAIFESGSSSELSKLPSHILKLFK